jgi:hypothetical protein
MMMLLLAYRVGLKGLNIFINAYNNHQNTSSACVSLLQLRSACTRLAMCATECKCVDSMNMAGQAKQAMCKGCYDTILHSHSASVALLCNTTKSLLSLIYYCCWWPAFCLYVLVFELVRSTSNVVA